MRWLPDRKSLRLAYIPWSGSTSRSTYLLVELCSVFFPLSLAVNGPTGVSCFCYGALVVAGLLTKGYIFSSYRLGAESGAVRPI